MTINLLAQMDTTSYSIGVVVGNDLKSQGFGDLDQASFKAALEDVFNGNELKVSEVEAARIFRDYAKTAKAKAGEDYLEANGKRPEVTTTASGLQYEVLQASDSTQKPLLTDKVNVHYHGTLIDGTVFDSSVDRGEPISFPLNGVIQGWQEGLQLMNVGSKYRFFIPYQLAYGERSAGPKIGPYSALVFDVTLIAVE